MVILTSGNTLDSGDLPGPFPPPADDGRDKTSIILRLVGKGAVTVRKKYFRNGKAELFLDDLQEAIPVVKQYRHLGAIIDPEMKLGAERRHRTALANAAYDSARDLLLQNRDLCMQTRAAIFQSAVVSTYFNLPLWITSGGEWTKMSSAFSRVVRRLLTKEVDGPLLFRAPLPLIHWATGCWPLEYFARRGRISALISLAKAAPPVLWAAIQNADQWKRQICQDMHWLVADDHEQWPHVSAAGWPHWCHLLQQSPDRVRRRVRKLHREEFVRYQVTAATSVCLWTLYRTVAAPGAEAPRQRHRCFICAKDFKTRAGLGAHYYKTHGRRAEYRQCLVGTFCKACSTEYWSTARFENHLRSSKQCVQHLLHCGDVATEIPAGYGSRKRRQLEVEQYTPAPPRRETAVPVGSALPRWNSWQKCFYADVCQALQEIGDRDEQEVNCQMQRLLRQYPLFVEEVREILEAVASEANELQSDLDIRPWGDAQFEMVGRAVVALLDSLDEAPITRTEISDDPMSRVSFDMCAEVFDWNAVIDRSPDDHGTQGGPLYILSEGWEAVWPPCRGELLSIAVVKDPMLLLPEALKSTWAAFLAGDLPRLRAPKAFWQHPLSAPFVAFRESDACP